MLLPRSLLRTHATAAARAARFHPSPTPRTLHVSAALRAIDMSKVDTTERLAKLRKLMKERNVDIYSMGAPLGKLCSAADTRTVVPSEDSHQSEYIAPCDARRGQLSRHVSPRSY
jgi:Xaa-Pro aminopeptidase